MSSRPLARNRQARDAGLRRVAAITRWSLAGALTGTGIFAGLAAQAHHGTAKATTTRRVTTTGGTSRSVTGGTSATTSGSTSNSGSTSASGTSGTAATTTPATPAPYVAPVQSGNPFTVTSGAS